MKRRKRIIVLKPGAMGDILQTSPFLKALNALEPESEIIYICDHAYQDAVTFGADKIMTFSSAAFYHGGLLSKIKAVFHLAAMLRNADMVYVLQYHFAWRLPALLACVRHKQVKQINGLCRTEEYLSLAGGGEKAYFFQPDSAIPQLPEKPYIAVAPSVGNIIFNSHQREWDGFDKLISAVLSESDLSVAVLGRDEIKSINDQRVHNYTGRTSVSDCWHIINNAERVICCDSGLLHLAISTQTPVTALFGPTEPEKVFLKRKDDIVIRSSMECAPCDHRGKYGCTENKCMQKIAVREVLRTLKH